MIHIIDPVYYQDYILAGKPEFMLKSTKNQVEEIYVVKKDRFDSIWYVLNRTRVCIGAIKPIESSTENIYDFQCKGLNTFMNYEQKQVERFEWFWTRFLQNTLPSWLEIRYAGRCAHCSRPLTHSESLPIGIGPDCFKKLGLVHKELSISK